MKKSERVLGIIYIPFHAAALPFLLAYILYIFNVEITSPVLSLICYSAGFVFILAVMFSFLRASFSDLIEEFWRAIQALILGYALYRVILWVAVLLLSQIMTGSNPNQEAIINDITSNFNVMIVVTVLLAPIVEESVFRGALFGTIRTKSRVLAYIVSALLFCVFHLWDSLLFDFRWEHLLAIIQYVPASIALTWCYERGGTIWSPILLHAVINLIGALQIGG